MKNFFSIITHHIRRNFNLSDCADEEIMDAFIAAKDEVEDLRERVRQLELAVKGRSSDDAV